MNVSRAVIRQFANAAKTPAAASKPKTSNKIKELQAKFQKDDGKPVFLKGGPADQILYRTTILLCLVGIGSMGKMFWDLSVPKQN